MYTGIPDYLSRAECDTLTFTDYQSCNETELYVDSVVTSLPATKKRLEEIESKQKSDYVCSKLIEYTLNGWPNTESCEIAKFYKPYRSKITVNKGLLLFRQT
jgi:hypothetical protein